MSNINDLLVAYYGSGNINDAMQAFLANPPVRVPRIALTSDRYFGARSSFGGTVGNSALAANTIYGIPFFVPKATSFDLISVNVSATGTATGLRVGLYAADTTTGLPAALLLDAGTTGAPSGTGQKDTAALSPVLALSPGLLYWAACLADGTVTLSGQTPIYDLFGGSSPSDTIRGGVQHGQAYGALPATFGAPTGYTNATANVALVAV